MDAASYYSDLTDQYRHYGGEVQGWHYGVWEGDVGDEPQALERSNELLVRGLTLDADSQVLDVGCGSGGFAVWAARRFGCRVTGITVCADHVLLARELARSRGVAERCRFLVMDMDELAFPGGAFDLVVNQETFCHAADPAAYLAAVRRILRPGGGWRAVAFSIREAPLPPRLEQEYREVREGFHIPALAAASEVETMLCRAGFAGVRSEDLTDRVRPTAILIRRRCRLPRLAAWLGLDWLVYSTHPRRRRNRRGHIRAAQAYSRGLLRGDFRHQFYSARRPDSGPPG